MNCNGVGAIWIVFRGPNRHTIHTNHTSNCHTLHTSMTEFCRTFHTSMTWINHRREGMPGCQRTAQVHGLGAGWGQETRVPLLRSMVGSTEADAKGRGSRWGVITKVQGSVVGRNPTYPKRRDMWAATRDSAIDCPALSEAQAD